jgi:hypothetical protein
VNTLPIGSKVLIKGELSSAKACITRARVELFNDNYGAYNDELKRAIKYLESALLVTETAEA